MYFIAPFERRDWGNCLIGSGEVEAFERVRLRMHGAIDDDA
jgi:hypothetical protein